MPIEKRQPGGAAAAHGAGTVVGASQKAIRQEAQAEQRRQQQMAIKARERAQQTAMEWDLEKMRMNSMLDYQKETRGEVRAMEAADVAHQRAVERIEMSKDMEFQYKEQERLRKLSANAARRAAYDKVIESGEHTADEPAMRQLDSEIETERVWIETGFRSPSRKEDPFAAALRGLLPGGAEGAATGGAGGGTPAPGGATPATAGQVQTIVNDKTGERMVSKNGGNTWEPIETPLYKDPSFYLSPFSLAKKALTARPFEKGFKHTNAPFRSK